MTGSSGWQRAKSTTHSAGVIWQTQQPATHASSNQFPPHPIILHRMIPQTRIWKAGWHVGANNWGTPIRKPLQPAYVVLIRFTSHATTWSKKPWRRHLTMAICSHLKLFWQPSSNPSMIPLMPPGIHRRLPLSTQPTTAPSVEHESPLHNNIGCNSIETTPTPGDRI